MQYPSNEVQNTGIAASVALSQQLGPGNNVIVDPIPCSNAPEPRSWVNSNGEYIYPENNGFSSTPENIILQPGTRVDRYGYDGGYFVAPEGTPYTQRSLPPGTATSKPYYRYEVVKPIPAQGGRIVPWFDQEGGGTQYLFQQSVKELLDGGYLKQLE